MSILQQQSIDPTPVVSDAEKYPLRRSADESALKLDYRTQLNHVDKTVVVRDYGQGVVEVGISHPPMPRDDRPKVQDKSKSELPFPQRQSVNLDRSIRRSKATIRRKCMAGGLNYLLTLTTRENEKNTEIGFANLKKFIRLVRKTNNDWKYVAVVEYQKRGAIHFHIAVEGFQNVRHLRSCWLSVVGQGQGNIQVEAPRSKAYGNSLWRLAKLAGYMTKYITKDLFNVATGRQRYRVAEGIQIPRNRAVVRFPIGVDWLQEVFDSLGADIGFRFESEQGWSWACSW